MITIDRLADLIHSAYNKGITQTAFKTQTFLKQHRLISTTQFFNNICQIIMNNKFQNNIRQAAATFLIASLQTQGPEGILLWNKLPEDTRDILRQRIIRAYKRFSEQQTKKISQIISALIEIEQPRNGNKQVKKWQQFINLLIKEIQEDKLIKIRYETLGKLIKRQNSWIMRDSKKIIELMKAKILKRSEASIQCIKMWIDICLSYIKKQMNPQILRKSINSANNNNKANNKNKLNDQSNQVIQNKTLQNFIQQFSHILPVLIDHLTQQAQQAIIIQCQLQNHQYTNLTMELIRLLFSICDNIIFTESVVILTQSLITQSNLSSQKAKFLLKVNQINKQNNSSNIKLNDQTKQKNQQNPSKNQIINSQKSLNKSENPFNQQKVNLSHPSSSPSALQQLKVQSTLDSNKKATQLMKKHKYSIYYTHTYKICSILIISGYISYITQQAKNKQIFQQTLLVLDSNYNKLISLLNNPNPFIVKNTLYAFDKLSLQSPELFLKLKQKHIRHFIKIMLKIFDTNYLDCSIKAMNILKNISQKLCKFTNFISLVTLNKSYSKQTKIKQEQIDNSLFYLDLIKYYKRNIFEINSNQQKSDLFTSIIINYILYTQQNNIILWLIQFNMETYRVIIQQTNQQNRSRQDKLTIKNIGQIISTAIISNKHQCYKQTLLNIVQFMRYCFNKEGVTQQMLHILGSAATSFQNKFQSYISQFFVFIKQGLQSKDQNILEASINCLSDIIRCHGQYCSSSQMEQIKACINKLIKYFQTHPFKFKVTYSITTLLGDYVMTTKQVAGQFIQRILNIIEHLINLVQNYFQGNRSTTYIDPNNQSSSSKPTQYEAMVQMKQKIIQTYSCLIFGMNSNKVNQKMFNHFQKILQFIFFTCQYQYKPRIEYIKNCLYLIYDSIGFYMHTKSIRNKVTKIIQQKQVLDIIQSLQSHISQPDVKQLFDFIHLKNKTIQQISFELQQTSKTKGKIQNKIFQILKLIEPNQKIKKKGKRKIYKKYI